MPVSGCGEHVMSDEKYIAALLRELMIATANAQDAEAERDRLRAALEQIARAGEGVPDWRAMADTAREALRNAG